MKSGNSLNIFAEMFSYIRFNERDIGILLRYSHLPHWVNLGLAKNSKTDNSDAFYTKPPMFW